MFPPGNHYICIGIPPTFLGYLNVNIMLRLSPLWSDYRQFEFFNPSLRLQLLG